MMGLFGYTEIVDDDIFTVVKDILRKAKKDERVVLVTPYIKFDEKVRDCIEEALSDGVKVVLLVRKGAERNRADSEFLGDTNIEVFELEHLHAKVYMSQSEALITSQNLYDFSDRKSKEIGVRTEERKHLEVITQVVEKWLQKADRVSNRDLLLAQADRRTDFKRSPAPTASDVRVAASKHGFCIRCKNPLPFDKSRPLCDDHYREWARYKNYEYKENVCHRCGKPSNVTYARPFCESCFSKTTK